MKMFSCIVKTLLIGLAAATIPANITFCGNRNPNLNDCVLGSIRHVMPQITNGVPEWGIPKYDPLEILEIEVANQDTFMAKIRNVSIFGLANLIVKSVDVHLDKRFITIESFIPGINVTGEFDGSTKILVTLPGKGPVTISAKNIETSLVVVYDVVSRKIGKFVFLREATVKLEIEGFQFHYESYENPGGPLDEGINRALNEDPKGALQVLRKPIENVIAKQTLDIGNQFCKHFTYDQLFPDRT